jgi:hypothetical protein
LEAVPTIESLLHRRTDLSTFLVHFTRDTQMPPVAARDNLLSILRSQRLEAKNTFGMARDLAVKFPEVAATQNTVCFTETPLEHAWTMCADIEGRSIRFNGYGLAFTKTFARLQGVNPVWYLDITPGHRWLTNPIERLVGEAVKAATPTDATDPHPAALEMAPILELTPFIDQMGNPSGTRKEFWWEREWRHVGHLQFTVTDLVVVFAPEHEHALLRDALTGHPGYAATMPRFADAQWGLERMIATLAGVSDPGPFPQRPASGW